MSLIDAIIDAISGVVYAIINVLPNADTPVLSENITDAFGWIAEQMTYWNNVFPMDALLAIFLTGISFEVAFFTFKLGVFIYDKIRGSG